MSNNFIRVLRNGTLSANRDDAISKLNEKLSSLQDGEICLASYGATWDVAKTILGVVRFKDDVRSYTIFDNEANSAEIAAEIAKLDATVRGNLTAGDTIETGKHVGVKVVEADGIITAVNVNENDIASDAALTAEINRAKTAEDKIEASVGLAANGSFTAPTGKNYINGATTVMNAVEKLDAQVKTNADKIAGMSVDEDNKTVTIDSKGLQFVAFTAGEIQQAADEAKVK